MDPVERRWRGREEKGERRREREREREEWRWGGHYKHLGTIHTCQTYKPTHTHKMHT